MGPSNRASMASRKSMQAATADWQKAMKTMDFNAVHKNRKCEFSVMMESEPRALTYVRQLSAANILDDTLIVIDVQEVHTFLNQAMFIMPTYLDPASCKLFLDAVSTVPLMDFKKLAEVSVTTKMLMIKLRILAALKEHIFKYEDPIRRRETLMEEYKMLIDVVVEAGGADSKRTAKRPTKETSRSTTENRKGGKKKAALDKEGNAATKETDPPCLMLQNNVRKQILQPRWQSVALKERTLQILIANCYDFSYLSLFEQNNVPIKCLVEVSLPSIAYPDVLPRMATSLRDQLSNVSIYSFNDKMSAFTPSTFNGSALSGDYSRDFANTPKNRDQLHAFWLGFDKAVRCEPPPKYIANMFYLKYVPIDMPIEEGLPFYEDQCLVTYDEIKYLLDSTGTIGRMYEHYIDHIKVFNMTVDPDRSDKAFCYPKYAETLNSLPPDVCCVPIILDALLNEVEAQVEHRYDENASSGNADTRLRRPQPKYYSVRHLFATLLKEYRMYSPPMEDVSPICSTSDNLLLNIKIDRNQVRMHEHNKMAERFHSYLNIRVPLERTYVDVMKRQPLCNILKRCCASGSMKTCNEIGDLSARLLLDPEQILIYLGIILFNLINWSSYKRYLGKRAKVDCNDHLKKLVEILTGHKSDELEYCDSVMESKTCHNINRKLDILFYEKLTKMEMLQELDSNCHWYNSIKYYYCGLLDAMLVEFDNKSDDFGVAVNSWTCLLRTIPNLVRFSKEVLYGELRWHMTEEMKYQRVLEAPTALQQQSDRNVQSVQSIKGDALDGVSFILKNTLKDVLVNMDLPELRAQTVAEDIAAAKKAERPVRIGAPKESRKSNVSAQSLKSRSSKMMSGMVSPAATKEQPDVRREKVFFVESGGPGATILSGTTTTFISKDGVKITFDKNNDLNYNTLNVDLNRDHFIMHITNDEYFKFHFYLQNDIVVNFVKPVNKSVVDQIKTDKLYTVFRNYSYRLNNFKRIVKKQNTYLISNDVLQRIRTKMYSKLQAREGSRRTSTVVTVDEHRGDRDRDRQQQQAEVHESAERIGDMRVVELQTRQDALEQLRRAKASQQPIFKICSSKLHRFNYITRKKSHANINIKDAAEQIADIKDARVKRKYLFRELVGSIDNDDDVASTMAYNYSVTMPTTLTVRSEVDIQGRTQIKQFYIDKGPQLRDVCLEVSRTFTNSGDMIVKFSDGQVRILSLNGDIVNFEVPLFNRTQTASKPPPKKRRTYDRYLRALRRLTKCYHKHTTNRLCRNSSRKQTKTKLYQYISAKSLLIAKRFKFPYPKFSILRVDGLRVNFREGKYLQRRDYFPRLEEDPLYATFKFTRQDGTVTELTRNGNMITTYPDRTTMVSSYEIDERPVSFDVEFVVAPSGSDSDCESKTVSWTCGEWVLIHSSREFRHPKYATVRMGGPLNAIDVILPCDVSLRQTGHDFKLAINANVAATFDASRIELTSRFCSYCTGSTSTVINIRDLYHPNRCDDAEAGAATALVSFCDSFGRHLEIRPDGAFVYDESVPTAGAGDLNTFHCAAHRSFNCKKLYLLKRNLAGMRLWPKVSYVNRLIQAWQVSEDVPDVKVQQVDDIYFLLKNYVPLFNKYLMEPIEPDVYFETYRFLQKMPYNKHTNLLLRESENVTMGVGEDAPSPRAPIDTVTTNNMMTVSDVAIANTSSTTLFRADMPQFVSLPQITRQQFVHERFERIQRICQKRRDREAAERDKVKEPINYFLYKDSQEHDQDMHRRMIEECPTDSNLKLTYKTYHLISSNTSSVDKHDTDRDTSIRMIYSGSTHKYRSEVFNVKSYISTMKYPSLETKYVSSYSSATLIKQHSVLDLSELSTLMHIYNRNSMSDPKLSRKHKYSKEHHQKNEK